MSRVDQLRFIIDDIDKNIVRLFEKRMETAEKIAQYKLENNLGILNTSREEEVIESALNELYNKDYRDELEEFIKKLMEISRRVQQKRILGMDKKSIKIGFQGVEGSFGHQAAIEYFDKDAEFMEYMSFEDVFKGLLNGETDYGVLPIENSNAGIVADLSAYDQKKYLQ